ncbi:MAG: glycosyltransferase [Rickettsiales bacterium]
MNNECAVCYVSDINFLLPSIISATGVRKFVPAQKADIFIFTVGVDAEKIRQANELLTPYSINVLAIQDELFNEIDKERLTRTHTPMAMFGRLFMQNLLPPECKRIVYLDGDTWILRDPTALINATVPEGFLAAAEDTIYYRQKFAIGATTKEIRHYFNQIGLKKNQGYFNSGVFATSRNTWETISKEAYIYYINNAKICEHSPDQSALNAVIGERRLRLSNKWNFQTQLKIWGADRYAEPVICHFNRQPKPWMGACEPWEEMYGQYQKAIAEFSALNLPIKNLSVEEVANANESTKKSYSYLKLPFVSWLILRLINFKDTEKNAWM